MQASQSSSLPSLSSWSDSSLGGEQWASPAHNWLFKELSLSPSALPDVGASWQDVLKHVDDTDKDSLRSWDFNVWLFEEEELLRYMVTFLEEFGLIAHFKIDMNKLSNFMVGVRALYDRSNPYHNFRHAFDVTHACYLLLTLGKAAELLTPLEILALLVASIGHDLSHCGTSNVFQVRTRTELAITYNDLSVLENFHAAQLFRLLANDESNILSGLSDDEYAQARRLIISCIIATDLSRYHVEITSKFDACLRNFDKSNAEHRQLLLEVLLKGADISNPARPFHISKYWSYMVQDEFFAQGDRERELGLPISAMCDRVTVKIPNTQMGFINFIVKPLFEQIATLLPDTRPLYLQLDINHISWQKILESDSNDANLPDFLQQKASN